MGAWCPVGMSAFWGGRSGLGYSPPSSPSARNGYSLLVMDIALIPFPVLAILVVLIEFETEWPCPIRGGVCQDAWVVMVMECVGSGGCGTAVDL